MDIGELRIIATVASFVLFVGILVWVWRNRKSKDFEDAAQLPFQED
jgi:cytochrome c oxidase cbb3-type subunit 4